MTDNFSGLLSSLWRASWQGAIAFAVIWVLCRILARHLSANAHCWLWRLSYLKLVIGLFWGGAILVPLLAPAPRPISVVQSRIALNSTYMPSALPLKAAKTAEPVIHVEDKAKNQLSWQEALATLYLLGVIFCLGRLLLAAWRTRRTLRSIITINSGPEAASIESLAQRMKLRHVPSVARSAAVDSPVFVAGTVLLPAMADYDKAEMKMILAHELAHARRRDLLWEWLGTLVQVMFYFHPVVVLARREERLAREAAADALAVEATGAAAAEYGRMLLSLSLEESRPRQTLLGAVGVIEGGTLLRRRLLALRDGASCNSSRHNRGRIAVTVVPLMALIFLPWQVTHGQTQVAVPMPDTIAPDPHLMPVGDKKIIGVVLNEKNEPIVGMTVSLIWYWSPQDQRTGATSTGPDAYRFTTTDAQGHFGFSNLPAGDFDYKVESRTNYAVPPFTDQYVPVEAPLILDKTDTQKAVHVVVSTGSLVSGRVVEPLTGKPLAGIFVGAGNVPQGGEIGQWDSWKMPSEGTTDAEGRYQVRVTPGFTFVGVGRITDGSLLSRRIRSAVQEVSVRPGQTAFAPDIAVSLHPVMVCFQPDDHPVVNTQVHLIPEDIAKEHFILDDHTDNTGTVVLSTFESGSFRIEQGGLTASGTFHSLSDGSLVINTNDQALVYPSGIGIIHLTVGSAAHITGTVVAEDDKPVPNALVRVVETDPKSHYGLSDRMIKTDADGAFFTALDPKGEFHAYIRADGFNQVSASDKPLTVVKGITTSLGKVHLMRADGFVSGRVVDSFGKPMSGVLAFVQGKKTNVSAAVADNKGHFRIPNVVPGEVLDLGLALKGEAPDSGTAMIQSNDRMDIPGVTASPTERQIVWHPHS